MIQPKANFRAGAGGVSPVSPAAVLVPPGDLPADGPVHPVFCCNNGHRYSRTGILRAFVILPGRSCRLAHERQAMKAMSPTPGASARLARRLVPFLCVNLLVGCASLPPLDGRSISTALTDGEARDTPLGRALAPRVDAHPGKSGIASLSDPFDAFAARILLTRAAERTLDIQSYIWHGDTTGTLMLKAVLAAAERGV